MSKLIRSDDTEELERWRTLAMESTKGSPSSPSVLTAAKLEALQEQAHKEGFDAGYAEGRKKGEAEARAQVDRLKNVFNVLAKPLEQLDTDMQQELVTLAIAIARQVIRRELKADPGHMMAIMREALNHLPLANRTIQIRLHPDDAAAIRQMLTLDEKSQRWELLDDPALTRGDCRVVSETSQIDATLEKRLTAVAAALLGGEREGEVEK